MQTEEPTRERRVQRRYSAEERKQFITEYQASGLSRRAFCEQRDLTTFHGWFKRWAGEKPKEPAFAEVSLASSSSAPIEVHLPNGVRIGLRHEGRPELCRRRTGCSSGIPKRASAAR